MDKINFHIHSTGSDGKLTPEEVVKEAIAAGIKYMCFTDHYGLPSGVAEEVDSVEPHSAAYVREVRRLQRAYKKDIDIAFGAELDWLEHHQEWLKQELKKRKYDYVLGSIHFLEKNGRYYVFDLGKEGKQEWLEVADVFGGVENFVNEYYKQIRLMAKSRLYDCVGHFDIVKMYNADSSLFSENSGWYKQGVNSALDSIKDAGMSLEINTHGLIKVTASQYPSFWILKEARKRNIPLTVGTDAHRTGQVNQDIDKAYSLAKQAGYKEIVRFKARKMISMPI